ncbi:homeobox protein Hox-C10-like [Tropilaelaps mercedesae]|uniref:Homeobox protein Hox-C10-like n=1 Tax=Tropilaelaps mercedesae TaxID=418985 RepID=A0A1V9XI51_9ACAR|nr:homeobox protein Hox-C10-like [Tropilaelaps mercedesae]
MKYSAQDLHLGGVRSQQYDDLSQPTPYEYAYTSENEEGSHGHSEKFDGTSRAEGNFFFKLADGRERHVTYTADENGFHPEIQTNELGTESKNPADAVYISSAPSGPDAAIEAYGGPFPESIGQAPIARAPVPIAAVPSARRPAFRRS